MFDTTFSDGRPTPCKLVPAHSPDTLPSGDARQNDAVTELNLCKAELVDAIARRDALLTELEHERLQAALQWEKAEERARVDAVKLAQLTNERDQLAQEGRAKKRRFGEVENKALHLKSENDILTAQIQTLRAQLAREVESLRIEHDRECAFKDQELERLRAEAGRAASLARELHSGVPPAQQALQERIDELQHEAETLRLALQNAKPERETYLQLQKQHDEYEEELRTSREEIVGLRERVARLEQEEQTLRAELQVRDEALRDARDTAAGVAANTSDMDVLASQAATIVAEAKRDLGLALGNPHAGAVQEGSPTSPADLGLAWSRALREIRSLRGQVVEKQQETDRAVMSERNLQAETREARDHVTATGARNEVLQMELQRGQEELAAAKVQLSVMREALERLASTGGTGVTPATAAAAASAVSDHDAASLRQELESSRRLLRDQEKLLQSKERTLHDTRQAELELRQQVSQLLPAQATVARLEQANEQLKERNRRLVAEAEGRAATPADFDSRSVKVLHLVRGPGETEAANELEAPAKPSAGIDLEELQAARQLERFKKATKRYVQEFREGILGILGWKVEMKGEGKKMRFHLTSKYQEGRELLFQLRPVERGNRCAEFDLLATPWAEQLQHDKQAMAYLEIYNSVPGFLAHITADMVSQIPLTS